jgi:hypothetical protein
VSFFRTSALTAERCNHTRTADFESRLECKCYIYPFYDSCWRI